MTKDTEPVKLQEYEYAVHPDHGNQGLTSRSRQGSKMENTLKRTLPYGRGSLGV